MPVLMASHDPKSHIAPHFDHLDLRNVMMPLTTWHHANAGAIGVM